MDTYLDYKYINMLSPYVRNFTKKSDTLWNFSCPVCGDSARNTKKARGYVFAHKGNYFYKCHNCGESCRFDWLLKTTFPQLYDEYVREKYKGKVEKIENPVLRKPKKPDPTLQGLQPISSFPKQHIAVKYLKQRQLPEQAFDRLYYVGNFDKWVRSIDDTIRRGKYPTDPRIAIPYFDGNKELTRIQARAIKMDSKMRYTTYKFKEDDSRVFGLDKVKHNERIYVVEGVFDSFFLPNCVAMSGTDCDLEGDTVFVFDNQPRNREVCKIIKKRIDNGDSVCLWPEDIESYGKDINEMIVNGLKSDDIKKIIDLNTHVGLRAKLKFQKWVKV